MTTHVLFPETLDGYAAAYSAWSRHHFTAHYQAITQNLVGIKGLSQEDVVYLFLEEGTEETGLRALQSKVKSLVVLRPSTPTPSLALRGWKHFHPHKPPPLIFELMHVSATANVSHSEPWIEELRRYSADFAHWHKLCNNGEYFNLFTKIQPKAQP